MEQKYLGELIDNGIIDIDIGFPCGVHNDSGEGIPHIRPFNIDINGNIYLEQIKFIPYEIAKGKPTLRNGDIIFNNTNSKELVGKCAVWDNDRPYVFSNHMTRIIINDKNKCNSHYLYYSILHHWMTGKSMVLARSHVAQASIIGERFKEIEVAWHSPLEQDKIAQALKIIQLASTTNKRELSDWSNLKYAITHKLFTCGLRGEAQKETEIGLVPESWKIKPLCKLCESNGGTIQTGPFGSQLHSYEYQLTGTPVINPTHLFSNKISHDDVPRVNNDAVERLSRHKVEIGDILFARRGEIGRHGLVSRAEEGWLCGTGCFLVRVHQPEINNIYLSYFFSTSPIIKWLNAHAAGAIMPNLNNTILNNIPIAFPANTAEQQEIVDILDAIDRKIDLHRRKKAVLEDLFKSLLHKLMTGEIRVDELDLSALEALQQPGGAA